MGKAEDAGRPVQGVDVIQQGGAPRAQCWSRRNLLMAGAAAQVVAGGCVHQLPGPRANVWTPPPEQDFEIIEHVWAPMPDGIRLSARLWLPVGARETPAPVVLEYIPYRKRDAYRAIDTVWGATLAARGIAFARIDVRGSGDSEGVLTDEYTEREIDDGVACIAWLARQPWCNGSVGMRGISWGGINTLLIAARRPPALKAIMPMSCSGNSFTDDAHYIGGALGHTNFQWGAAFKTVMAGPPDPDIVGPAWRQMWRDRLEATPNVLAEWLSHQRYDSYWRRRTLNPADIQVPTYLVSGWQDTYCRPVLHLLGALKCPARCIIGPWGHTYPWTAQPHGLEWAQEEIRWWRQWLTGDDTGIMDGPSVKAFMAYAAPSQVLPQATPGRWIAEKSWPAATQALTFHLTSDGLSAAAGPGGKVVLSGGKVVGLAKPEWLDRPPVEQSVDDRRSLYFDTVPLARDIEVLGTPAIIVRVTSSKPIAQLAVRLTEVTPDGQSWLVTYGLLNLAHRNGTGEPAALEVGRAYDVHVDLFPVAHRFKRGGKIRVALSDGLWPLVWPSPEVAELTIDLGNTAILTVPVRPLEVDHIALGIGEVFTPPDNPASRPTTTTTATGAGRYFLDNNVPPQEHAISDTATFLSRGSWERSEIVEGDPDTCRWTQRVLSTWRRGDWRCEVEASYELTSTASAYLVTETLTARSADQEIFRRSNTAVIDRDFT